MTNVPAGIGVCVAGQSAGQAAKLRLVSKRIPGPAARAGERSVGRVTEPCRHPYQGSQQQNALCKEPRAPLPPPGQPVRILKRNASARLMSTAHQLPSFFGLCLSLRAHFIRPIHALLLLRSVSVPLLFQDRAEVWALVAIRAGYCPTYAHVHTDPLMNGLFVGQRDFDSAAHVPLAVFPKDLALFAKDSTWQCEGAVDRPVCLGRDVQLADALHHYPQVKACRFLWRLDLGSVNQLGSERRDFEGAARLVRRLQAAPIVNESTPGCSSSKFAFASRTREAWRLPGRNLLCGNGVQPLIESRQRRKRVRFDTTRKQLEFIRENHLRCHT